MSVYLHKTLNQVVAYISLYGESIMHKKVYVRNCNTLQSNNVNAIKKTVSAGICLYSKTNQWMLMRFASVNGIIATCIHTFKRTILTEIF